MDRIRPGVVAVLFLVLIAAAPPAAAQEPAAPKPAPDTTQKTKTGGGRMEPLPRELEGVGLEPKLNAQIPLEAEFKDEHGDKRKLGDYFDGKRPVIITLNYFR